MNLLLYIGFSISTLLIFSYFNSRGLVDGPLPAFNNFVMSLVFLLVWFAFGLLNAKIKKVHYPAFASIFWMSGLGLSAICITVGATPLWIAALMFLAPLNGLRYHSFLYTIGFPFVIINTLLPLFLTLSGYYIFRKYVRD